jgi:hypothetical protein
VALPVGCAANDDVETGKGGRSGQGGVTNVGVGGTGTGNVPGVGGFGNTGNSANDGGNDNPVTCAEAAANRTYVGCDFWPTITYNPVYKVFDFAAVVANPGVLPAEVSVERNGASIATVTVAPGSLEKILLPWVDELKGPQFDGETKNGRPTTSVRANGGGYHLKSSYPVTAWQFNPLQYRKDANVCPYPVTASNSDGKNCESVSSDAALLIPTTAMTGNYRVIGRSSVPDGSPYPDAPGGFTITATADDTKVKVQLAGALAAGSGITAAAAGSVVEYTLNAGDVAQLLGQPGKFADDPHADLAGSIVNADKPVQVIAFVPITASPSPLKPGQGCCADHLEETVLPAEALGKHYIVTAPSTRKVTNVGHFVRFYGNFDGTALSYKGTAPPGAPASLAAGQIVEVNATAGFEVTGTEPFAIASILKSGTIQNGCTDLSAVDCYIGDPAMSSAVTVDQFRTSYVFLAPDDYAYSLADVLVPTGAKVKLDGATLSGTSEPATDGWAVFRVLLEPGNNGAHKLESDKPVGLQVMGYGHATGYYYPGGLNLRIISQPPVVK